jgi:hypothetical protein
MFQTEVVEKIKTHILRSVTFFFFFENRTIYEIMWKNIIQPDRPQVAIYIAAFPRPQCYDMRALSLLLLLQCYISISSVVLAGTQTFYSADLNLQSQAQRTVLLDFPVWTDKLQDSTSALEQVTIAWKSSFVFSQRLPAKCSDKTSDLSSLLPSVQLASSRTIWC